MLLRCVPNLRELLLPDTVRALDEITGLRVRPAPVTPLTPWRQADTCSCTYCALHGRSAQDNFIERRVYEHMNTHRTAEDKLLEKMGPYDVGGFCDIRRMFEAALGLITPEGSPIPGIGLCVVHRCCLCGHETRPDMLALETADALGRPFPGRAGGSTRQLLDQLRGADSILHHLSKDPIKRLREVQRYGACCRKCDGDRYRDTVLPWALDTERPLPPLLRLNKLILSEGFRDISDTLTVSQPGTPVPVTYQLLAVVYGSGAHFTCDVRYAIDAGDSQFFH
jgi:hypothetical protein